MDSPNQSWKRGPDWSDIFWEQVEIKFQTAPNAHWLIPKAHILTEDPTQQERTDRYAVSKKTKTAKLKNTQVKPVESYLQHLQ